MGAPMNTFVQYQKPLRTRQTIVVAAVSLLFALLMFGSFTMAFIACGIGTDHFGGPNVFFHNVSILVGSICIVLFIIASVLGISSLRAFLGNRRHFVRVTNHGIDYDHWFFSWSQVNQVRELRNPSCELLGLSIDVRRREWHRANLTLPIQLEGGDSEKILEILRSYVISLGKESIWRS
jgi:hypothetical protein